MKKSRKVLAALVDAQLDIDKLRGIHLITSTSNPDEQFTYHAPNPKGNPFPMPAITQDYNDDTLEPEVAYPDEHWEEEAAKLLPRQLQRLMQTENVVSCPPVGISQAALNAFIGNAYMQELQQSMVNNDTPSGLEEVDNGVVHPVTKETITKYKTLINDPLLRDDWMKGMCKELGRLEQGYRKEGADDYVKGRDDSRRPSGNVC